jgi:uncharacterized protein (DUF4213/DUF364 family)
LLGARARASRRTRTHVCAILVDDCAVNAVTSKLLALLERLAQAWPLPAVRGLHLPPVSAERTRAGEFCAIELDDGSIGLSFVLLHDTLATLRAEGGGEWVGVPALQVARRLAGTIGAERALGFAAVNALTRHLFDRALFEPPWTEDPLGVLDLQPGDHLGMVGLFPPLIPLALKHGARLTVVELRADLVRSHSKWHVTGDARELAHCNKILLTSTVLLNDTLDTLQPYYRHADRVSMVGPGASCLPDPLFDAGMTVLGGRWIDDAPGFVAALLAGRRWNQTARKFALGRDDYPGFECLLARAKTRMPRDR